MSNKENIRRRCNCQCQEALINAKEDCRQFELKYNEIRNEGERLYQQYEIKSSKLREALEINHQLTDENQQLHDQNQGLAERLVQVLQEKGNIESEKQQEFARLLKNITIERQEMTERFASLEDQNKHLIAELTKAKERPPLQLDIKVELPKIPDAAAARAAELNIIDPETIETMPNHELREQIDRVCISNELLRDEVRSLEFKVRTIEQRCSAQTLCIAEKDAVIADLNSKLKHLSHLETAFAEKQSEVLEMTEKHRQLCTELGRSQQNVKELTDQIEQLLQQIERARAQHSLTLEEMQDEYRQKEELVSNLIHDLERKMHEVEGQSSLFIHSQSQIAILKEQDQRLRNQLAQLQLAYRNTQDDLKRIYTKHKKDMSDLEQTYKHGEYIERYEMLVLRCGRLESLCSNLSDSTNNLLAIIDLNVSAFATLKRKKESLHKAWQRFRAQNEELATLKSQLAGAKRDVATLNQNCNHFMSEIDLLEKEISVLKGSNENLQRNINAISKHRIVSDCKSLIFNIVSTTVLKSECNSKPRLPDNQDHKDKLAEQLNAELKTLEQLEAMVEFEHAEILRLQQENENLTHLVQQEREVNRQREEEFETFTRSAELQISKLLKENDELKNSCIGESQKQHEILVLQSRITELSVELEIRQKEHSEILKFNQKLEDHNTTLLGDLETLQDICKERDAEIELLQNEISEKKIKLNALEESLETFKQNVKSKSKLTEEELEILRCSNTDLIAEIEDLRRASQKEREISADRISSLQSEREKLESRIHELKLKDNARQGQIEAMESQKLKHQQQLKTNESMNFKLHKQVGEVSSERDKLKQMLSEMVKHKELLLQEIDKLSRQCGEADGSTINHSDYESMKDRYESKILKLKQAMLDYKTRGDRKITGVVQDLNMVSRRCEQLELCVAEIGRICPQNAIIQSLVEEVKRSKQKVRSDDKY